MLTILLDETADVGKMASEQTAFIDSKSRDLHTTTLDVALLSSFQSNYIDRWHRYASIRRKRRLVVSRRARMNVTLGKQTSSDRSMACMKLIGTQAPDCHHSYAIPRIESR